jgi:hypothetical protein
MLCWSGCRCELARAGAVAPTVVTKARAAWTAGSLQRMANHLYEQAGGSAEAGCWSLAVVPGGLAGVER